LSLNLVYDSVDYCLRFLGGLSTGKNGAFLTVVSIPFILKSSLRFTIQISAQKILASTIPAPCYSALPPTTSFSSNTILHLSVFQIKTPTESFFGNFTISMCCTDLPFFQNRDEQPIFKHYMQHGEMSIYRIILNLKYTCVVCASEHYIRPLKQRPIPVTAKLAIHLSKLNILTPFSR
jgi:hypothetical protein